MADPERFYLVWGVDKPDLVELHDEMTDADAAARRLALKHPSTVFVVMVPDNAYRAGETPVQKVYLQYPTREAVEPPPAAGPVEF